MSILHRTEFNVAIAALSGLLLLPACSVNVKKDNNGQDKNVDIKTPIGGIHVSNDADVRDTGLPVYPGARIKEKEENGNKKSANVDISTSFFAVKVIAVEYESDDPPEELISYYKSQLKKYGNVLECHTHGHGASNVQVDPGDHDSGSKSLSCEDSGGNDIELKAGTKENQHIVAIEPRDKGTNFGLVRVMTHGKDDKDTI